MKFGVSNSDRENWARQVEERFSSGEALSDKGASNLLKKFISGEDYIKPENYLLAIGDAIESGDINNEDAKKILTALEIPLPKGMFFKKTPSKRLSLIVKVGLKMHEMPASKAVAAPSPGIGPAVKEKSSSRFSSIFSKSVSHTEVRAGQYSNQNLQKFTHILQSSLMLVKNKELKDAIITASKESWNLLPKDIR